MAPFKSCPNCEHCWAERQDFLADPEVALVGYQSFIQDGVLGLFLFNHAACQTTLTVPAKRFEDLQEGPLYALRTGAVPREPDELCLASEADAHCPHQCECGYVERVSRTVRRSSRHPPDRS